MNMVNLKINGIPVTVPAGTRILDAAKTIGVNIPTLCYLKDVTNQGSCRMCVVEVTGAKNLQTACFVKVKRGYGSVHQYSEGNCFQKDHARTYSFQSRAEVFVLHKIHKLRTSKARFGVRLRFV